MSKPFTSEGIRKVAETLEGSCKSLDDVLCDVFDYENGTLTSTDLPIELLRELDDIVMECQSCSWWVEASEVDDDSVCEECRNN